MLKLLCFSLKMPDSRHLSKQMGMERINILSKAIQVKIHYKKYSRYTSFCLKYLIASLVYQYLKTMRVIQQKTLCAY